jgi:hypothetical protein
MNSMIRFTPCGCERASYKLMPRKWWMRPLFSYRRYRCSECKANMLLRDGRMSLLQRLIVLAAILLAAWTSIWLVGYMEDARDAAWKRSVSE